MESKLVILLVLFTGVAAAQFPDAPGRELTIKTCSQCHEPERAASLRQSKDAWGDTIAAMVQQGLQISDADYDTVLNYLTTAFPSAPPKPLKINTASAIDLESAFSLLHSQAVALVEYRDKNGKFKSLDDLKKVPGLDVAKIEAKKDRISFE